MPKDAFNREIDYLRISVIDRCNLRCVYCMPLNGLRFLPNPELLTAAEIERVARAAVDVGFRKFRLTGGEPTLRADLVEIVERLASIAGVGELALTTSALSSLTPAMVPWMDLQLVWRRSMAAGIVLEALVERGGHEAIEEGLLLSAIVHPLGRIVLGMMFPKHYEQMVAKCRETGDALQEQERQTLPISHTEVMAHLLASWRVPQDVFLPLKFASDDFSALAHLSKSTRSKTELVKVAILLGRLAVGRWEHWDLLRFPAASVMSRIGIRNVAQIIRQAKADVGKLAEFHPGGKSKPSAADPPIQRRAVAYCNFSGNREDLLAELLLSLGYQPKECSVANLRQLRERPIVNCLGAASAQFAALRTKNDAIVIADDDKCDQFRRLALTVGLPNSYGRLRDALQRELAEPALEPAVSAS